MVAFVFMLLLIAFVVADLVIRVVIRRREEAKLRKEREAALDIGLRLDFTEEAKSLKRVDVPEHKARILAVDDEEIVLSSFRKILVLAGYSVDTVETGPEALGLIQKHDYDFVFTDLKMPDMDGVEVTKAVKHLRPDIDVIVITGYATIETAVETMKYGAMDYVQKPFTEDELIEFVNKSLIRRHDHLEKEMKPTVHLVTPSTAESASSHEFNVPSGLFISQGHTWIEIQSNGTARLGVDDFVQKIIGSIDDIILPRIGRSINRGEELFSLVHEGKTIPVLSPLTGKISGVNSKLIDQPGLVNAKPYEIGWTCELATTRLSEEVPTFMIGANAVSWYQGEIDRYMENFRSRQETEKEEEMDEKDWQDFAEMFLKV